MKNAVVFLLAFIVVLGSVAGLFYLTEGRAQAGGVPAQTGPKAPPAQRQLTITMEMFGNEKNETHRWIKDTIVANLGDTLVLTVKNDDLDCADEPHGFTIPAFGVDFPEIQAGDEKTVTVKLTKAGIFDFKCSREECAKDHDRQTGQILVLG